MLIHVCKCISFAILTLLVWLVFQLQLFGDEAFYWLEGQNLAWSYAELPGWTAWMIRLGTEVFGNNYFAVRVISFTGFLSILWVIHTLNRQQIWQNLSLILSVPIAAVIATMALPDIWLLFFVLWSIYFLFKATKNNRKLDWALLGVLIALSINVHVRMWIWLFFAGIAFIGFYYSHIRIIKPALLITLPIALLGLLPILFFNIVHDFPLLNFQFSERHPWQFQLSNINFLFSQVIVITPLVLLIWFKNVVVFSQNRFTNWIVMTALIHWVFYVVMSLFVDGLRTNVHWLIISYVPVLTIISSSRLKNWAIVTGFAVTICVLFFLALNKQEKSNFQARILDNSLGWQQLAHDINIIQQQQNINALIVDYFMTAAELAFELNNTSAIKVLPHEKNRKHGREKQLNIMGMLLKEPQEYKTPALLVIENSTLKLQSKGEYYQQLCRNFNKLEFIQSINISNTSKQYHVFKVNSSELKCEIPPIFYLNHRKKNNKITLTGWAVFHDVGIKSLEILSDGSSHLITENALKNKGISKQFPEINDPNLPNNGFRISLMPKDIQSNKVRIKAIGNNGQTYYSQIYFLN